MNAVINAVVTVVVIASLSALSVAAQEAPARLGKEPILVGQRLLIPLGQAAA